MCFLCNYLKHCQAVVDNIYTYNERQSFQLAEIDDMIRSEMIWKIWHDLWQIVSIDPTDEL